MAEVFEKYLLKMSKKEFGDDIHIEKGYQEMLQMVACSAYACLIIYFIISAGGYNDDFHNTVLKFQFIYDTDSIFQKFDFKQSGQIAPFISQGCAIASVLPGNGIFSDFLNALDDRLSDGIVQGVQVIQSFG